MRELYRAAGRTEIISYSFATPAEGYATFKTGDERLLSYTSDSGYTFTSVNVSWVNTSRNGFDVDSTASITPCVVTALSSREILLATYIGRDNVLLSSSDKGNTFKVVRNNHNSGSDETRIYPVAGTDTVVMLAGNGTRISIDRGQTWTSAVVFATSNYDNFRKLDVFNTRYMFASTGPGSPAVLLRTTNGGTSEKMPIPKEWSTVQFSMISPSKGFAFVFGNVNWGYNRILYSTLDSGYTWNKVPNKGEPADSLYAVTMMNDTLGFAAGEYGKLYKTTDGGMTWLRLVRTSSFSYSGGYYAGDFKMIGNDYVWVARQVTLEMGNNFGGPAMRECTANSFSPAKARAGDPIIVKGDNFSVVDSVTLGGIKAASWEVINKNTIKVIAGSVSSGELIVYTPVNTATLPGYRAVPTFSTLFPQSGTTNMHVTLEGTSLSSVTQVKVGNVPARAFKILSNNKIQISIPYTSNGVVQLISPDTVITSHQFYYYRGPAISQVTPLFGPAGTTVTITGSNFSATADSNFVYFGGIKGQVIAATPTSLKVTVPQSAPYANISVCSRSLIAGSAFAFSVTFPDGGSINPSSFSSPQGFDAGGTLLRPGKTVVADFDGDGKPDLITPDWASNNVVISRNNSHTGTISFTDHLKITAGSPAPNGLFKPVPADINGDGKIDFSIGNNTDLRTYIYLNTSTPGNISFKALPFIPGLLLEVADVNQDGRLDLIQRIGIDGVVRTNYSEPDSVSFESYPIRVPTNLDTVWPNASATTFYGRALPTLLFYSTKGGSFQTVFNYSVPDSLIFNKYTYNNGAASGEHIAGDYNKDGLLDIGIRTGTIGMAILSSAQGQNGEIGEMNSNFLSGLSGATHIALQDMDGDGKADLLHGVAGEKKCYLYHNTFGEGESDFATAATLITNNPVELFTIADLDGDNKKDIILLDTVANKLLFYQNGCSPRPYINNCLPVLGITGDTITLRGANFTGVSAVMLGDQPVQSFKVVDAYTITFVVGNHFTGDIRVTNPSGTAIYSGFSFGRAPVVSRISPATGPVGTEVTITGQHFSLNAAENTVNFSGVIAPVISATATTLKVKVPAYTSTGPVTVTTNQRVGEYTDFFKVTFPGPKNGFSIATFDMNLRLHGTMGGVLMDMDNDGKQDIVTHDYNNLIVYRNNSTPGKMQFDEPLVIAIKGNGQLLPLRDSFEFGMTIGRDTSLLNPAVMDMNGDGKADIAIFNRGDDLLYVYINNSTTGSFQFLPPYTISSPGATVITIHDYDGDGKPDILHAVPQGVRVFRNTGSTSTFSLGAPVMLSHGYSDIRAKSLAFADIDNDGKIDAMDGLYMYYNASIPGRISCRQDRSDLDIPNRITALYDLNNNDSPDLAVVQGENNGNLTMPLYFRRYTEPAPSSGYQRFVNSSTQEVYHWANQIAAGDFDGDGLPDLLVNNSALGGYGNIGNLLKNVSTNDSLKFLPFVPTRVGADGSGWAAAGDLDGDSKPDLVLFGNQDGGTWVARNRYDEVVNLIACSGVDTSITSKVSGSKYQWQVLKTGGDFTNISDDTLYVNTSGKKLQLKHISATINGFTYRCLVDNKPGESTGIQVTPNTFPSLDLQRTDYGSIYCPGKPIALRVTAYSGGTAPQLQWWMDDSIRLDSTGTYFECDTFTVSHSIQVKMISNGVCPDKAIVESINQQYNFIQTATPQVTLTANSLVTCASNESTRYTFSAQTLNVTPINGPSYKWYYNGALLANESGPVLIKPGLHTGDSLYVTMSVALGNCITGRDYRSNTITLTTGNLTTGSGSITGRSYSDCPFNPKTITFASATTDGGSKVDFYETAGNGQLYLLASIPFIRDSVVYTISSVSDNITQQYFCKVTPPDGSCQQAFTTDTISLRWYKWIQPVLQIDGAELVVKNSLPGTTFRWWNKDQDTSSYPPVSSGILNRYAPPSEGYYIVAATLDACNSIAKPIHYLISTARELPVIRPNPVSDVMVMDQIKLTENWTTLEILDGNGAPRMPAIPVTGMTTVTVNTSKLGNGIYFAVLRGAGNKSLTVRFVKMK
jgi:hypothetical protein